MKFRHIVVFFALMCVSTQLKAQEEIVYDQYYFNYYLVNPAVAGAERCSHLMLTGKFQWVGLQDAPMTQTLSFRTRVLNNVGLGAYLYNDRNGYSYRQGGQATFAYHIPLTENSRFFMRERSIERQLSFGVSAKANHFNFSGALFDNPANAGDIVIDNGGKSKGVYFNANFGVYFLWDNFFLGASGTNLIPTKMTEFGVAEPVPPLTVFAFTGYDFEMDYNMTLEPAVMFKMTELGNRQLDVNMKFMQTMPDNEDFAYWLQVCYRQGLDSGNAQALSISPMGGIRYKGFHLAYAYALGLTAINRHNYGSHEIMLGYTWCVTKHFCR